MTILPGGDASVERAERRKTGTNGPCPRGAALVRYEVIERVMVDKVFTRKPDLQK